ncbi:hypothetical protein PSACC_02180 [Paramicrosporidium saccamoebae]|uniref:Large ribosomal subunit protein bL31c n=1 Tax=Paramicrosporidium saccamoebae TaxID=1246581 RepID=A0A2H9TJW6_9FUNG|nr:hypothetical protein PSACC_02180 [Paramicrosporidium saccamoebae]
MLLKAHLFRRLYPSQSQSQSRRLYQNQAHPQLFRQVVQLTDGSTVRIVSLTKNRPFVKAGVDSLTHPSWNPQLRSRMMLSEHGEVAKFKERFEEMDDLDAYDGLVSVGRDHLIPVKTTKKVANKKK